MNDLDTLLSKPLEDISDNGFSQQVLRNIQHYHRQKTIFLGSVFAVMAAIMAYILSVTPWFNAFDEVTNIVGKLSNVTEQASTVSTSIITQQVLQNPMIGFTALLVFFAVFAWQES